MALRCSGGWAFPAAAVWCQPVILLLSFFGGGGGLCIGSIFVGLWRLVFFAFGRGFFFPRMLQCRATGSCSDGVRSCSASTWLDDDLADVPPVVKKRSAVMLGRWLMRLFKKIE